MDNLISSTDQFYFCAYEQNLAVMQKVSEIMTNPNYQPFKLKTKKKAQIYTQYYVSNTPPTDNAFYHLQSIRPIDTPLLQHTAFNISQSVRALNQAYANFGCISDGPINPILLHNQHYVERIKPAVDAFVNEVKIHSTSRIAMADREKRIALINEIKKENISLMKKLFKTQQCFNLNVFNYAFNIKECTVFKDKQLEELLTRQMIFMINKFHKNYQSEILALFFCVQRDLSSNYVLTVYCATERECQPLSMKNSISLHNSKYLIIAPHSNITLSITECHYSMDIQGVEGTNEKSWKTILGGLLAKYNYVYYESKFVSPKFIYIECDSKK